MNPDQLPTPPLLDTSPQEQPKRKRWWLYVVLVLIVIGGGAAVFWLTRPEKPKPVANNTTPPVAKELKVPKVEPMLVAKGLESPTAIESTPDASDKRLFVLEQAGTIRIVSDGKVAPKPFLDIHSEVLNRGEMGLLGLAFHPSYQRNGYLYINYIDKNQNTVIARFTAEDNAADPTSEKVLLTLKQPYANHNGGGLAFGPDGYLYASLGDGGSRGDPENRAQNKTNLFGKILRLDVDKGSPSTIPKDNPFAKDSGAKPEIWAYGLRNPWRISFDKKTGDLYIADVGQGDYEEINVQKVGSKGGENYGWRCFEGKHGFNTDNCGKASAYTAPVFEFNHEGGRCSITGGYVYRGAKYPALAGKYFYGDYCNGQLFYAAQQNGSWQQTLAAKTSYAFSTFGQGSDGELYFADYQSGKIYQIKDTAN